MARTDTLGHFLTDVANAIRTKKGTAGTIAANTFDTQILSIPTGGGGTTDIYKVTSIAERDLLSVNEGDICLVYSKIVRPVAQDDVDITELHFPDTVTFSEPLSGYSSMNLRPTSGWNPDVYINVDSTMASVSINGDDYVEVFYSSEDGLEYTKDSSAISSLTLSAPVNAYDYNAYAAQFVEVGGVSFQGIYQYNNSTWENLDLGMNATSNDVLVDKTAYSNNGVLNGTIDLRTFLKNRLVISDAAPSDTNLIWIKPKSTYSDLIDTDIGAKKIHIIDESKMTARNTMINVNHTSSKLSSSASTPRLINVGEEIFGCVKSGSANGEVARVNAKTGGLTSIASPFGACTVGCLYHFIAPSTLIGVSGGKQYSGTTKNTHVYLFDLTSPYSYRQVFSNQVNFTNAASDLKYSTIDNKIYMKGSVSGSGTTYVRFEPSQSVIPTSVETITEQEFNAVPYYDTQYSLGNDYYVSGMVNGSGTYTISRITKVKNNAITPIDPIISNGKGGYDTISNYDELLQAFLCKCGDGFLTFKDNTLCYMEFGYNSTEDTIEITKLNYLYRYQSTAFMNRTTFKSIGYYDDQNDTLYIYSTADYSGAPDALVTKIENFDITPCSSFGPNDLTLVLDSDNTCINTGVIDGTSLNIKDILLPYKAPAATRTEVVNTGILPDSKNAVDAVYCYDEDASDWVQFLPRTQGLQLRNIEVGDVLYGKHLYYDISSSDLEQLDYVSNIIETQPNPDDYNNTGQLSYSGGEYNFVAISKDNGDVDRLYSNYSAYEESPYEVIGTNWQMPVATIIANDPIYQKLYVDDNEMNS